MTQDCNPYEAPTYTDEAPTYTALPRARGRSFVRVAVAWSGAVWPPLIRLMVSMLLQGDTDYQRLSAVLPWVVALGIAILLWWIVSVGVSVVCTIYTDTRLAGLVGLVANLLSILVLL